MRYVSRQICASSGDSTNPQAPEDDLRGNEQPDNNGGELLGVLESIDQRGSSLFTSAISSRNIQMVKEVARLIELHCTQVRRQVRCPRPLCKNIFLDRA